MLESYERERAEADSVPLGTRLPPWGLVGAEAGRGREPQNGCTVPAWPRWRPMLREVRLAGTQIAFFQDVLSMAPDRRTPMVSKAFALSLLTAVCAAAASIVPVVASGEPSPWDQARVTEMAQGLAEAVKDLRTTVRSNPGDIRPGQRRAYYAVIQDLRLLGSETRHLGHELVAGKGHDETLPIYLRIQTLRRDAEENGRKALISNETMGKISKAEELLIRIAPYYREDFSEEWRPDEG